MVQNPPENMPRITPYLYYNDVSKAVNWLTEAFGLQTRFTMPDKQGRLMHAEMIFADGVVMMGTANPKEGGKSPQDLKAVTQSLYIYVDDLETHYHRAKAVGARITMEPEEMFWGDRIYAAEDMEGQLWTFAQHVKDIAPEQMQMPE